jgi:DNA-binding response OmpR family regulator
VADEEEWVRLPADESETAARLSAFRARRGQVSLRGTVLATGWGTVTLSATEAEVVALLLQPPGAIVAREAIAGAVAVHGTLTRRTVDDVVYRLRRRLRPLGLDVFASRGRGHLLGPRLDWPVPGELVLD